MNHKAIGLSIMAIFLASAFAVTPMSAMAGEWSEPTALGEQTSGYTYDPVIESNSLGWQIAGWNSYTDGVEEVYANRYTPDAGWSGPERVGYGGGVEVGIDDNGNSTVVWTDSTSVMATRYVPAYGEWDETTTVFEGGSHPRYLSISVCRDGGAAAIWIEGDYNIYASIRGAGPFWKPAGIICQDCGWTDDVDIAMDDYHNAVAVWTMYDGAQRSVWADRYVYGEGWGTPTVIESQTSYSFDVSLDITGSGLAIAAWTSQPNGMNLVFANVYTPGVGWSVETPIDDPAMGYSHTPDVAIDDAGHAVAVWRLVDIDHTYDCTRANVFDISSGWGTPTTVQENLGGFMQKACMGADGDAYVSWLRSGDTWDSYVLAANHHTLDGGWEEESVITVITNITGFDITADVLKNATMVWSGVYGSNDTWSIFVSDYSGTPPSTGDPEAAMDITEMNSWKRWKFDGRSSTDDVRIVKYLWDFGDGEYADSKVCTHSYQKAGEYVVTLTVWDNEGNSDSVSAEVLVKPRGM